MLHAEPISGSIMVLIICLMYLMHDHILQENFRPFFSLFQRTEMRATNKLSLCGLLGVFAIVNTADGLYIDKRQQKDAVKTPFISNLRPLVWGDVNFIHTTDTHGN